MGKKRKADSLFTSESVGGRLIQRRKRMENMTLDEVQGRKKTKARKPKKASSGY